MTTARVSYVYKSDVSESIQLQIQQLHKQEAQIMELEAELSQLRKAHAELERDLAPYRIDSPFADIKSTQSIPLELYQVEAAPIHQCPDEILCLFFENYVLIRDDDDDFVFRHPHFHIRRLLLVCRRWYTLMTNTAKLWTRIEIFSPLDLFDIGARKSLFPYIFACLNRSKSLPITVHLDMQLLNDEDYITESLIQHAKAIVDEDEHELIIQQIRDQDWEFRSTWFDSQLERVIACLIGADGEHIKRWKAMRLYLPEDADMAIRVWNILARGLKAVENVVIENFPSPSSDIFMPDFGTVKKFDLTCGHNVERPPITSFGLSPSTLKHLEIALDNPSIHLAELLHFQQLRTLHLGCSGNKSESLDFSISLPHLKTLILAGGYGILARLRFNFPSLDLLTVIWNIDTPLPAIHPRHIQASMPWRLSRVELKKAIRDCILLSNALECITINRPLERDDVNEVVAQSKLEGMASSLTQIIVEHGNGEVERIRV
jgi:F-box-like